MKPRRNNTTPDMFASRRAGTLLHLSSLPSPHGIGDLGPAAHEFARWCASAGQSVWQMLPVGPVGAGDSPYASTSSFAGEPLFISLELLVDEGLLSRSALRPQRGEVAVSAEGPVNWQAARRFKEPRLHAAYQTQRRRTGGLPPELRAFERKNASWLSGWCRFAMSQRGASPDPTYHMWVQWEFQRQWNLLRARCAALNVLLLGDVIEQLFEDLLRLGAIGGKGLRVAAILRADIEFDLQRFLAPFHHELQLA